MTDTFKITSALELLRVYKTIIIRKNIVLHPSYRDQVRDWTGRRYWTFVTVFISPVSDSVKIIHDWVSAILIRLQCKLSSASAASGLCLYLGA